MKWNFADNCTVQHSTVTESDLETHILWVKANHLRNTHKNERVKKGQRFKRYYEIHEIRGFEDCRYKGW